LQPKQVTESSLETGASIETGPSIEIGATIADMLMLEVVVEEMRKGVGVIGKTSLLDVVE